MASGFNLAFFFCVTGALLMSGTVSAACPRGWSRYGSRCFIVQTLRKTVADAELTCVGFGGNLASVHSYWEHRYIRHLIYRRFHYSPVCWIGLSDAIQERKWMWTDGSRVNYKAWGRGEPNNRRGREHCTEINFRGTYWNDARCTNKLPFVCVKRL